MGTNYYFHPTGKQTCSECRQPTPGHHIGKSSVGWNFSLRVYPRDLSLMPDDDPTIIKSLEDWERIWRSGGAIFDEYGDVTTIDDMLSVITRRARPGGELRSHVGYVNELGKTGIFHRDTATYGGPTWDLCDYEFS